MLVCVFVVITAVAAMLFNYIFLFFCLFVNLFVFFVVATYMSFFFVFLRDISVNTVVIQSVRSIYDISEPVENLNDKALRQSGWISIDETLPSIAEFLL